MTEPLLRRLPSSISGLARVHARQAHVDGWRLFYREAGAATAPAIVLLHDVVSSSHMFRDLMPLLAQRWRVLAPDLPGCGHSEALGPAAGALGFDTQARVLRHWLDQIGVGQTVYYLHGLGAAVGLRLASARPQQVAGLVVQNALAHRVGVAPVLARAMLRWWHQADATGLRSWLSPQALRQRHEDGSCRPSLLNPDGWLHDAALMQRPGQQARVLALLADDQFNGLQQDRWRRYFLERQPHTLIAWGRRDPLLRPAAALALARDLPHALLHWLDGGHFALDEHAEAVARKIHQHFAVHLVTHPH